MKKQYDMRNPVSLSTAQTAARQIRGFWSQITGKKWPPTKKLKYAVELGTGWGGALALEDEVAIPLTRLNGFGGLINLRKIPGHDRVLLIGKLGGKMVALLSGRIHLNEDPGNPDIFKMVRLQTEMLLQLGVKKLIVTAGVGALPISRFGSLQGIFVTGDVVAVNALVTVFAPQMPLYSGEFCPPEDLLSDRFCNIATASKVCDVKTGAYAMVLGPYFEGRKKDK